MTIYNPLLLNPGLRFERPLINPDLMFDRFSLRPDFAPSAPGSLVARPWAFDRHTPFPPPKTHYCGSVNCPGHKWQTDKCLDLSRSFPSVNLSNQNSPLFNIKKNCCGKLGCPGHLRAGMICF